MRSLGAGARRALAPATLLVVALTSATVLAQIAFPGLLTALGASWPEIARGQVWRLVTGSLVHGLGVPQLVVNMAALVVFGPRVERAIGSWRFAGAYFCAGGLVWLAVFATIDRTFVGAGASAAVFAVMGAGATLELGRGGDRRWAALSAAAVAGGLGLGVLLVSIFGSDVLFAHLYGSAIGLLAGLVYTGPATTRPTNRSGGGPERRGSRRTGRSGNATRAAEVGVDRHARDAGVGRDRGDRHRRPAWFSSEAAGRKSHVFAARRLAESVAAFGPTLSP